METELICIVEGQGDEISVPLLVRRVAFGIDSSISVRCRAWRRQRGTLLKPQGLEKEIDTSARRYPSARGILVLLDADRDCPAKLGPELLRRAKLSRPDLITSIVLAKREYEAWFITARESLRAYRDLNLTATIVRDPEEILGAKEWLSRQMHRGKAYVEIRHQPAFTQLMDLELAKKARSFRKFVREIELLLAGSVQAPQGL